MRAPASSLYRLQMFPVFNTAVRHHCILQQRSRHLAAVLLVMPSTKAFALNVPEYLALFVHAPAVQNEIGPRRALIFCRRLQAQ